MHLVRQEQPFSSAYQCPGPGRRVKGAFGVARDRFATPDPATTPQVFRGCDENGGRAGRPQGIRAIRAACQTLASAMWPSRSIVIAAAGAPEEVGPGRLASAAPGCLAG